MVTSSSQMSLWATRLIRSDNSPDDRPATPKSESVTSSTAVANAGTRERANVVSHPLYVRAVARVDADLVAGANEQGHIDRQSGFELSRFVAARGRVTLEARIGLGDLEHDVHWHVDADWLVVVHQQLELHAVLQVVDGVAELLRRQRKLVVRLLVHA